ncbi:hypothetical protein Agub_g15729, partial [Astrephomene gubernaculifera]
HSQLWERRNHMIGAPADRSHGERALRSALCQALRLVASLRRDNEQLRAQLAEAEELLATRDASMEILQTEVADLLETRALYREQMAKLCSQLPSFDQTHHNAQGHGQQQSCLASPRRHRRVSDPAGRSPRGATSSSPPSAATATITATTSVLQPGSLLDRLLPVQLSLPLTQWLAAQTDSASPNGSTTVPAARSSYDGTPRKKDIAWEEKAPAPTPSATGAATPLPLRFRTPFACMQHCPDDSRLLQACPPSTSPEAAARMQPCSNPREPKPKEDNRVSAAEPQDSVTQGYLRSLMEARAPSEASSACCPSAGTRTDTYSPSGSVRSPFSSFSMSPSRFLSSPGTPPALSHKPEYDSGRTAAVTSGDTEGLQPTLSSSPSLPSALSGVALLGSWRTALNDLFTFGIGTRGGDGDGIDEEGECGEAADKEAGGRDSHRYLAAPGVEPSQQLQWQQHRRQAAALGGSKSSGGFGRPYSWRRMSRDSLGAAGRLASEGGSGELRSLQDHP